MWFKNLVVYRLPADWPVAAAELEEKLAQRPLQPCGAFDMLSRGWVHAGPTQRFVHTTHGQHLIALGVEQKLLPASIVRQVATDRAKVIEEQQGFPVGRRQMREIKERVLEELRARALSRRRVTRAWIDPAHGWLVVDAAGPARAEELIETLRDTLGSLAVQLIETERSPSAAMSAWLALGDAPLRFVIDQDLELQAADKTKATIRYTRYPLEAREVRQHLTAGMYVTRLGLTWNDRISFMLTEKLQVKRVEFLAIGNEPGQEQSEQQQELAAQEQFEIDFLLMTGELHQLLAELNEALGVQPEKWGHSPFQSPSLVA
ncbi:MAG TPA: recombination-associated protein RdgC [Steroidobacteraceae bacterium]|jgi:recombination associated protein RdgC